MSPVQLSDGSDAKNAKEANQTSAIRPTTDSPTNQWTDKMLYKVTWKQLKSKSELKSMTHLR